MNKFNERNGYPQFDDSVPTKQQIEQTANQHPQADTEALAQLLDCTPADILTVLGEQADFDQARHHHHRLQSFDDKPGTGEFSDRGRADLKVKRNDPRFADNPMADHPIILDEFTAGSSEIDRLHQMLTDAGISDQQIKGGVSLTQDGKMKVAARLGIGPQDVEMYLNVITQQLRDQDSEDTDNALAEQYFKVVNEADESETEPEVAGEVTASDAWEKHKFAKKDKPVEEDADALAKWRAAHQKKKNIDTAQKDDDTALDKKNKVKEAGRKPSRPFDLAEERYAYEPDALGSLTIRDTLTGRSQFIQGAAAERLLTQLKTQPANRDMLLGPLVEAMDDTPVADFWDEIEAKSGSYNFQWKLSDQHGTGTVLFQAAGTPALRLVDVRDAEGNEVATDHTMHQELLQQARDFIGQE